MAPSSTAVGAPRSPSGRAESGLLPPPGRCYNSRVFNIGSGELALIAVAALLILGPKRLPELARGIGKFMREFRRQTDDVRNVVEREFYKMDQDLEEKPPAIAPAAGRVPSTGVPGELGHPNKPVASSFGPSLSLPGKPVPPPTPSAPAATAPVATTPDDALPEGEPIRSQLTAGMPEPVLGPGVQPERSGEAPALAHESAAPGAGKQ